MPRDFMLKICVSDEEHDAIKTTADEAAMTISDYVRVHLAHRRLRQTTAERDIAQHLSRASSTINQIAGGSTPTWIR